MKTIGVVAQQFSFWSTTAGQTCGLAVARDLRSRAKSETPPTGRPEVYPTDAKMRIAVVAGCLVALLGAVAQTTPPRATALGAFGGEVIVPARVAVGPAGMIYVTEPQAGRVTAFDPFFRRTAVREGLSRPLGIAVDSEGRIYLAEEQAGRVSVFDANWNLLFKLGAGDGEFLMPNHVAVSPGGAERAIYVSDSRANHIKVFVGGSLTIQFGTTGSGDGQFRFPTGICLSPSREVFVVDQNNDRIQVFDAGGNFLRKFPLGDAGNTLSGRAQAAFVDPAGRLYVADAYQGVVKAFDAASGARLSNLGSFGQLLGQLRSPAGLAMDPHNRLFIASMGNGRVEVYGLDGFLHVALEPAGEVFAAGTSLVFRAITGGPGPFAYQWWKNGAALEGATNSSLAVTGLSSTDAGSYSVAVTHPSGVLMSASAPIGVILPPSITSSPTDATVLKGANVVFQVGALGDDLSFQWLLNGISLEGATRASLLLTNVQPHQSGSYSVRISNSVGTVVSSPALLAVLEPPTTLEIVAAAMESDGFFHLTLNADPGFNYSLDASADFLGWDTLGNFRNDAGLVEFIDTGSTNWLKRYYRLRWLP